PTPGPRGRACARPEGRRESWEGGACVALFVSAFFEVVLREALRDRRRSAGAVRLQRVGQPAVLRGARAGSRRAVPPRPEEQPRRTARDAVPHRVGGTAVAQPLARDAKSGAAPGPGPDDAGRLARTVGGDRVGARGLPRGPHRPTLR